MPRIIPEEDTSGGIGLPIDAADVDVAGPLTNAPSAPTDLEIVLSEFDSAFGAALVSSVFGRTGVITAAASDYDADQIDYDNTTSGLTATDAQAAIDEVEGRVDTLESDSIAGPVTNADNEAVVFDGLNSDTIKGRGVLDFGSVASVSEPTGVNEGDRYYNTDLDMEMRYDIGRAKWLSINEAWYQFGRNGNTAAGSFFEGTGTVQFTSINGHPAPFDGTVVGIAFTRDDTDSTVVEVTLDGILITGAEVTTTSTSNNDSTIDADFTSAGTSVLGVRNQSGGLTITDVMGWIRIKWRA